MSATKKFWRGRPVVYRAYDKDGRLIYVGASHKLPHRVVEHRFEAWWMRLNPRFVVKLYPTMDAAFAAEAVAIQEEQPAFNVKHTGRHHHDFTHWTVSDFKVCKQWQDDTWHRGYLPQSVRQVGKLVAA
jgi:excinuclease UvrABC nuclease subunit